MTYQRDMQSTISDLTAERERLLWIAEHLFQMVPPEVWRASCGCDDQGHYEGEYHAERLREELAEFRCSDSERE